MWKEYRLHCKRYGLKECVLENFMNWYLVRTMEEVCNGEDVWDYED